MSVLAVEVRDELYQKFYDRWLEIAREQEKVLIPDAFELLDRMLPTEVIQLPAVGLDEAGAVCGVPVVVAK